MTRSILHLDLDTFFVSVERLLDSRLNGKPILVGGTSDRGVVSACSYETRGFGVHSGMSMKMARRLCPEALVIRGDVGNYSKYSKMVTEIIAAQVPVLEKASIDEFYADMSGMDKFFGIYKYATEIRKKIIKETGLPISMGLSVNKVVSKVAAGEAKPNNQLRIDFGKEKSFLSPLSVRKIPMIGNKTYHTLVNLGVKKVAVLQEMPVELLQNVFGKNGPEIWKRANGIDNRPVVPYSERKSISTERTFEKDSTDWRKMESILTAMTEKLAYQLRKQQKFTSVVAVKIRFSDFNTHSKQVKIPYTSGDHILIPRVIELFRQLYNRRLLIRLIGVRFGGLIQGSLQLNLFEDNLRMYRLYEAIDDLRMRYGADCVLRAGGVLNLN